MKYRSTLIKSAIKGVGIIIYSLGMINASAQSSRSSINGIVVDSQKRPIPGAIIQLSDPSDTLQVRRITTNENGQFFTSATPGYYLLSISMLGFRKQQKPIRISPNKTTLIDSTMLEDDVQVMREVVITGAKNVVEFGAGKIIVNPSASIITSQGNTLEVLKGIPGLAITDDGTIMLNGQQGVIIRVNGIETYLSGAALANLLKSTAASSVEKIEVLTSPSAEYNASGKAGVINIHLKKWQTLGETFTSNVNYQQGKDHREDIWARATIRKKNLGVSIDIFHFQGDKAKEGIVAREIRPTESSPTRLSRNAIQDVALTNRDKTDNIKLMADFELTKSLYINTYLGCNLFHRNVPGNTKTLFFRENNPVDSVLYTSTYSSYLQTTLNGGLRAEYSDASKREISYSLDFLSFNHNEDSHMFSTSTPIVQGSADSLCGKLNGDIHMLSTQINTTTPLTENTTLQAGGKLTWVSINNLAAYHNFIENKPSISYLYSGKYAYQENNNAAYLQINSKICNVNIQVGLRVENTRIDGTTYNLKEIGRDSSYHIRYTNLFPNTAILYSINNRHEISFTYNRRITRPNYRDLSPFDYMADKYTVSKGNPKLKAELTHNLELMHIYRKTYRVGIFFSFTNNAIAQGFKDLDNGGLLITPENLASNKRIGIKLDAGKILNLKFWQVSASLSTYYSENKWTETNKQNRSGLITTLAYCNNLLHFTKGWSAQLTGYYNSKISFGQMEIPASWSLSGGLRKSMLNDNLSIHMYVNDIFGSIRERALFESGSIKGFSNIRYDETSVGISIYYSIKKGKQKERDNVDGSIEERKRINF